MGQRLVIVIKEDDKNLATAYYHWSGYTDSALMITNQVIDVLTEDKNKKYKNRLDRAISALYATGAGFNAEAQNAFLLMRVKDPTITSEVVACVDRNEGLIDVDEDGMDKSIGWAEGLVEIDLGEETVDFQVYSDYDMDWYFECYFEDDHEDIDAEKLSDEERQKYFDEVLKNATVIPGDCCGISFDDFADFAKNLYECEDRFFVFEADKDYLCIKIA